MRFHFSAIAAVGLAAVGHAQTFVDAPWASVTKGAPDVGGSVLPTPMPTPTGVAMIAPAMESGLPSFLAAEVEMPYPPDVQAGDELLLSIAVAGFTPHNVTCTLTLRYGLLGDPLPALEFDVPMNGLPSDFDTSSGAALVAPANPGTSVFGIRVVQGCSAFPNELVEGTTWIVDVLRLAIVEDQSTTTTTTTSTTTTSTSDSTTTTSDSTTTTTSDTTTTTSTSATVTDQPSEPTTTADPTATPEPSLPVTVGGFARVGCVSGNNVPGFALAATLENNSIDVCTSLCAGQGSAALFGPDCYCGPVVSADMFEIVESETACDIPCPGNPLQRCGGSVFTATKDKRGALEARQSFPAGIFISVYLNLRFPDGTGTITPTGTATLPPTSAPGTVTTIATVTTSPNPDWWSCRFGACPWEIIILKPCACDGGCDGIYWERVCDRCSAGEERWRPIRCAGDSCRGKDLCEPVKCSAGHCGDFPVVEEEKCDECEGGVGYRPKEREDEGGAKYVDAGDRKGHEGVDENGFVITSGMGTLGASLASLVLAAAPVAVFYLV